MSPWLLKVWRLAWARAKYPAIGGWRRLIWRLWWDLRLPLPDAKLRTILPILKPAVLHWPQRTWLRGAYPTSHYCGAPFSAPWCEAFEDVTCPECRKFGEAAYLQYKTNTR